MHYQSQDSTFLLDPEIQKLHDKFVELESRLVELGVEQQEEMDRLNRDFELDLEDLFRRPNWKYPNGDIET